VRAQRVEAEAIGAADAATDAATALERALEATAGDVARLRERLQDAERTLSGSEHARAASEGALAATRAQANVAVVGWPRVKSRCHG
jgi:hypothetical protein